jgi:hypothetical protein
MMTSDWQFKTWGRLPYSVQAGKPAFDHVHGMSFFDYCWSNPKAGKAFNDAMTSNSAFTSAAVQEAYDFSALSTLVDVGGGHGLHGLMLASVLQKYPHQQSILFDVHQVVEQAAVVLAAHSVADRCRRESGDFFEAVPADGDAYLLKHIIHDWNDEQCIRVLQNCRQAMKPGSFADAVLPARLRTHGSRVPRLASKSRLYAQSRAAHGFSFQHPGTEKQLVYLSDEMDSYNRRGFTYIDRTLKRSNTEIGKDFALSATGRDASRKPVVYKRSVSGRMHGKEYYL